MIEGVRHRLHLRLNPTREGLDPDGADAGGDDGPGRGRGRADRSRPDALAPEIELVAYSDDCRVYGYVRLNGDRLTDMLNDHDEYALVDVMAEQLPDGEVVETKEIVVTRDELLAVEASWPRGNVDRRRRTRQHAIALQVGPYVIEGYVHTLPGVDPLTGVHKRGPMVPLTDASIAFVSGGVRRLREAATVVVNRDRCAWIVRGTDRPILMPELPAEPESGPLVKDFTGLLHAFDDPDEVAVG